VNRIGIFSGTFDPVHEGHLQFAKDAIEKYRLDMVYFLVESCPRRKQGITSVLHRNAMLKLAISGNPQFGNILLNHERFTTKKTLPILIKRSDGAELFFLMGDDTFHRLIDWPNLDKLIISVNFIVGVRSNKQTTEQQMKEIRKIKGESFNCDLIESKFPMVSSSSIRAALQCGKKPFGAISAAWDYAIKHKLY